MRKIYNSLAIAISVILFSCEKHLETNPDMRTEINTVDKVKQLVGTAYPNYGYLAMAEMYSDNVSDKGPTVTGSNLRNPFPELYRWEDIQETGENTPTQYWNSVYFGIATANQALEAVEKYNIGPEVKPYKGEALIARAYGHFMLSVFFAKAYDPNGSNDSPGIPYVLQPETKPIVKYSRGTVASVYELIEKDLVEGLALLDGGQWQVPKFHFTKSAAHAFAARFYMFKGEWQKVIDHANQVFVGGDYTGNLRNYVSEINALNTTDYQAYFTKSDKKFNLLLREIYSVYQRSDRFATSRYGFSQEIFNTIYSSAAPNPITPAGGANSNFISRSLTFGTGHYTTYVFREHFHLTDATAQIGYAMMMQPLFTADEALMNRAEAYAQLGQINKAIDDLNYFASVRRLNFASSGGVTVEKSKQFFNVADDNDAIIKTALHFKRVAFMGEGLRWFDILRHKITVKHNFIDENSDITYEELGPEDPRRVFQIPEEAIKLGGLEPNPR